MSTAMTRTSAQQNKVIAHEFYARISEGDIDGALALLSRDATWWLPGDPSTMPVAGLYTKDEITQLILQMTLNVRGRLISTVTGMVAEGDKVALEVETTGELHNGRSYHDQYHTLMRISDGEIREIREYHDTQHTYAVWFGD